VTIQEPARRRNAAFCDKCRPDSVGPPVPEEFFQAVSLAGGEKQAGLTGKPASQARNGCNAVRDID
jgi:hypothetical protein